MVGVDKWVTKKCGCMLFHEVMTFYKMSLKNQTLAEQRIKKRKIDFPTFLLDTGIDVSVLIIEL